MQVIPRFLYPVAPGAESFFAHLRSCSHGESYPLVGLSSDDGKICVHILRYTARILRLSRICRAKVSSVPPSLSRATLDSGATHRTSSQRRVGDVIGRDHPATLRRIAVWHKIVKAVAEASPR